MMNRTHTGQVPPKPWPAPLAQATPTQAMPWLDDITPTGPIADELDDMDDLWLADVALVVLLVTLVIFVVGAGTGYLYARL